MAEIVYSQQRSNFTAGRVYRNPRFFERPMADGVTKVIIIGDWPKVAAAYRALGIEVEERSRSAEARATRETPAPTEPPVIPANWRELEWKPLRAVATQPAISRAPIINGGQAVAAIEGFLAKHPDFTLMPVEGGAGPDIDDGETDQENGQKTVDDPEQADPANMSDDELRAAIEDKTGKKPRWNAGREKLLEAYAEAVAAQADA